MKEEEIKVKFMDNCVLFFSLSKFDAMLHAGKIFWDNGWRYA
jgi:hypothetical protein